MVTATKRVTLFNDFKVYWRRRWDSNPRRGSPLAQLATECFRPLSHASDGDHLKAWGLGGKGESYRSNDFCRPITSSRAVCLKLAVRLGRLTARSRRPAVQIQAAPGFQHAVQLDKEIGNWGTSTQSRTI